MAKKEIITLHQVQEMPGLELLAQQVVEGFLIGLHKSPYHGFSVEFAEHRLYNPGEPIRHIDWKVFARSDKLFVKKYEEETNLRCQIVMDVSSSMYYPVSNDQSVRLLHSKFGFSCLAAASLMYMLRKQRDAVGLTLFSDHTEFHSQTSSLPSHLERLFRVLEEKLKSPEENRKTSMANSLHELAEKLHRRSLVILFSDWMDTQSHATWQELSEGLQHLLFMKNEVILFDVKDKTSEEEFQFENRPYQFVDLETGEKIKLQPQEIKEAYSREKKKQQLERAEWCGMHGIDYVEADIAQPFDQVMIPFLLKRQKML